MNAKKLSLFVLCFLMPIVVYIYTRHIARGVIMHVVGILGATTGVALLLHGFTVVGSNIELLVFLGCSIIFSVYGLLCVDAVICLRKKQNL